MNSADMTEAMQAGQTPMVTHPWRLPQFLVPLLLVQQLSLPSTKLWTPAWSTAVCKPASRRPTPSWLLHEPRRRPNELRKKPKPLRKLQKQQQDKLRPMLEERKQKLESLKLSRRKKQE